MGSALRYWHWVRVNGEGKRQVEEIPTAKAFFQQQFPQFMNTNEKIPDAAIQRQLMDLMGFQPTSEQSQTQYLAELCLRCFISYQIDQTCFELVKQFGVIGGFKQTDLLCYVLDDFKLLQHSKPQLDTRYQSLADKILQTFNPECAQLSTWTKRLVKSHEELNHFLWGCGVHLATHWSILNNYQPKQLERLLAQFYNYSSTTAKQAAEILDSYQTVYLSDRLQQNRSRFRVRCQPPTPEQLNRILVILAEKGISNISSNQLLEQLESIADLIRRSRQPPQEPPPNENYPQPTPDEAEIEMQEFLERYHQLLVTHLDEAISQVLNDRLNDLRKRKPPKDQKFLHALRLYCQSLPMSEIAGKVGLSQQYQVSRLLNLKALRQGVQHQLLLTLKHQVLQLAYYYTDFVELGRLEQAVVVEVERILKEAEREKSTPNCSRDSLLTRRIYHHL